MTVLNWAASDKKTESQSIDNLLERIVFFAICASPFQSALSIPIGTSPLKISEILFLCAFTIYPFSSWWKRKGKAESILWFFAVFFIISALVNLTLVANYNLKPLYGFTRTQLGDIVFYLGFSLFALIVWKVSLGLGQEKITKALIIASWLCIAAVLFQKIGILTGQENLVEMFGFTTKGLVEDQVVTTRNGPFVEGQQLGFYVGFLLIVCVAKRRYFAVLGLLYCIYYSQSTTATLGIALSLLIVIIINLNIYTFILLFVVASASFLSFIFVAPFRDFLLFQLAKLGFVSSEVAGSAVGSLNIRTLKSVIGWEIMKEHPVFGVGPGQYSVWFFDQPLAMEMPSYYYHADHRAIAENVYAQIAAETGVPGIVFFCLYLAALLFTYMKMKKATFIAASVFLIIGVSTQSMWTFMPIWIFAAYLSSSSNAEIKYINFQQATPKYNLKER